MEHPAPQPSTVARVAEVIRDEMRRQSVSLNSLAESAGIPKSTLSRKLRGIYPFDLSELERIAAELQVRVSTLTRRAAA